MVVTVVFGHRQLLFLVADESGPGPEISFPETIIAAMLSLFAVFGVALHMHQYSDRLRPPVFLALSILLSLAAVSCIWLTGDSFYSRS
ncbi:hypothetical protein BZK42_26910 [Citrobacter braakii]|uniref:Uncharacterized protein n=1 Tax=Citrobacter braakii TaxID=57706 RepID=A0A1V8NRL0_CITBR|nr:hypothetical protein BZK42_26910 [Citrobacter braakii]